MKIAVTGGAGQLGTHVLRRLVADRAVTSVVSLDLAPVRIASKKLQAVKADVRDPDLARHFAGCDAVVHLAFIVTGEPGPTFNAVNIGGSQNVFRAAVGAGVKKLVYSSSVAAYGVVRGHPVPILETTPRVYQPSFAYSAAKFKVEEFLDGLEKQHPDVAVVRFRPAILVGFNMEHALGDALRRRVLIELGTAPAPVVWDEDVADAIVLALKKDVRGAFNLAADDPKPLGELGAQTGFKVLRPSPVVIGAARRVLPLLSRAHLRKGEDPAWLDVVNTTMVQDCTKARTELGWAPKFPKAIDVVRHYAEFVPARTDPRLRVFFGLISLAPLREAPADMKRLDARMHLVLTGPSGGDFDVKLKHGRLRIHAGIPRPPTVTVTLKATVFLDMLAGRTDYSTAQLTGKIRTEGEALHGMILQGLVSGFRAQAHEAGVAHWPQRRLAAWFAREPALKGAST